MTDDNGNVIERDVLEHDGKERCYLLDAVKFDIIEWDNWYERYTEKPSPKPAEFDALELGFWNADGKYKSPNCEWRNYIYKTSNT